MLTLAKRKENLFKIGFRYSASLRNIMSDFLEHQIDSHRSLFLNID